MAYELCHFTRPLGQTLAGLAICIAREFQAVPRPFLWLGESWEGRYKKNRPNPVWPYVFFSIFDKTYAQVPFVNSIYILLGVDLL